MRNIALLTTHSITAICAGQFVKFAHEADGADLAPSITRSQCNDRSAVLSSAVISAGCSHAAKCPPLSSLL